MIKVYLFVQIYTMHTQQTNSTQHPYLSDPSSSSPLPANALLPTPESSRARGPNTLEKRTDDREWGDSACVNDRECAATWHL